MRFLTSLFWVVVAVLATTLAVENWRDVSINLWGDLQADIKIPVLFALWFGIGFVPAYIVYRTRLWRLRRDAATVRPTQPAPTAVNEYEVAE
jgi:uncharacterized membrane protein YciS (DUF1049 family)